MTGRDANPASADHDITISPVARLDRVPTGRVHVFWAILLGVAYVVETFDNVVFSYLAPTIKTQWNLNLGQVGMITSAVFIGMCVGALIGGRLADRVGRKQVLIWSSVFYSAMSLVSAVAPNFEVLFWSRLLTGLGVQAATGVVIVYLSEMFPNTTRGRFFTIVTFAGAIASPATAFLARGIIPLGGESWRWMFVLGGSGIIVAVAVAIGLPESVRWLSSQGKPHLADKITMRIEQRAAKQGPLPPLQAIVPVTEERAGIGELFTPIYLRRLAVLGVSFFLLIFGLYGFNSWLTTILTQRGLSDGEALSIVSVAALGTVIGPVLLFGLADRIERRTALLLEGLVAAGGLVLFAASAGSTIVTTASAMVVFTAIMAATTTWYTYIPEAFPTAVRGIAAGTVSGIGRIAGIAQGVAVAAMLQNFGDRSTMYALAVIFVLMGVIALFGPRATRRTLEDISSG